MSLVREAAGAEASDRGHSWFLIAAAVLLLIAGAGLRVVRLTEPPLAYQQVRQYNDALLARKYDAALGGDPAGLPSSVIRAAAPKEIEPPILESITAAMWRVLGEEPLWFPRALSVVFWTIGGWFVFLLVRRLASAIGGLAAIVVWSFLPFSVTASRVFQPDPLMVVAVAGAILALVIADEQPTKRRMAVAGITGGLAALVKLPALFFVLPVLVALAFRRGGWRTVASRQTASCAALVVAPAVVWNVFGLWIGGFLRGQEGNRILPRLLVTTTFWRGWLHLDLKTFGVVVPLAALLGVCVARGRARWVGGALVAGYVCFGLVFTFHYMTHDYYHLALVLVLSVGVGLLASRVESFVQARSVDAQSIALACIAVVIVLVGFRVSIEPIRPPLVPAAIPEQTRVTELEVPRKLGVLLRHSAKVVYLAPSYGETLLYYGGLAGTEWKDTTHVAASLQRIRREHGADFFVVTDMHRWSAQPALHAYLSRYPRIASTRNYVVYDLQGAEAS